MIKYYILISLAYFVTIKLFAVSLHRKYLVLQKKPRPFIFE